MNKELQNQARAFVDRFMEINKRHGSHVVLSGEEYDQTVEQAMRPFAYLWRAEAQSMKARDASHK